MPLDIMQQLDDEKRALASSGDNSELLGALSEIQEKAGKSSEALSVLDSIIKSMTASGKNLHSCIGDVVKDFEAYDRIALKSRKETSALSAEYATLGATGANGINRINDSLIQSISLLQTVEREVKKYENALASVKAPSAVTPKVSSTPMKQYASGGQIQGRHKTGDRNLVRVNAGEWIFNERQMDNLKKQLGAHSHADVFRRAGGNPNRVNRDSYGTPMAFGGLRGRTINSQISQQRNNLESWYNAPRTYSTTKPNIEAADLALERLNKVLDKISRQDFDRLNIDGRIEAIFSKMNSGTVNTSRALQSLTRQIDAVVNIVEVDAEATRQLQLAADTLVNVDLSRFSGDALIFAENLERSKKILESAHSTAEEKATARMEINSNKAMLDLSQQRYLTRGQRAQRQDLIKRYNAAGNAQDRANVAQEATKLGNMDNLEREIGLVDSAMIGLNKRADNMVESMKEFLGGTPTGMAAVGVAIGFAAKQAADFVNNIASGVEETAKLCSESARLQSSFDSTFGKGTYDSFRKELGLTRKEMTELAPLITDSYREAGVQMEHVAEVAKRIREEFGAMDPKILQEALSVMKELTSEQTEILRTGFGSSGDRANMYANLMESGKAGKAADLLEQGIFGGDSLSANVSEGDREIIKNLQMIKRVEEEANVLVKDGFGMFSSSIPLAKAVSAAVGIGAGVFQAVTTLEAIRLLFAQKNATEGLSGGINAGGGIGKVAGGLAAAAITTAVVAGFSAMADHFERKKRIKEEKREQQLTGDFNQTGFYGSEANMNIDWDAVNARGARYAAWGAGIGGTVGGTVGGISGSIVPLAGTAAGIGIGATAGAAAGGAAGYTLGSSFEISKQLGDKASNPFLMKQGGGKQDVTDYLVKGGLKTVFGPLWGTIAGDMYQTTQNDYNKDLLTVVTRTSKYIAEIKEYSDSNRRTEIKSLRLLESAGIVVNKVKSGAFTKFYDRQVESAQKNIETMGMMGGNSVGYSGNVSIILDNASESFSKNMDVLAKKQQDIMNQEGISAEARVNATRAVLDEQASVTKKFCEAIYNSIGNYDKIPEIIQESLQTKIDSMVLDVNTRNMVGTTAINSGVLGQNFARSNESLALAAKQYYAEQPQIAEAQRRANVNLQIQAQNYRSQQDSFSGLGLSDVVGADGQVDAAAITRNQAILRRKNDQLDADIKRATGIGNFDHTASRMDELMAGNSTWKKLEDSLSGMTEEKWETDGSKEYLRQMSEALTSDRERLQTIVSDDKIDARYRKEAQAALNASNEGWNRLQELIQQAQNGNSVSLDQVKAIKGVFSAGAQAPAAMFQRDRMEVENRKDFKQRRDQIGRAESAVTAVATAQNTKVLEARNAEKSLSGLITVVSEVQKQAEALVNQLQNDPTLNFYKAQEANLTVQKDYLMATGGYSQYLTGELDNMSRQMTAQQDAVERVRSEYTLKRKKYQDNIQSVLSQSGNDPQVRGIVDQLNELNSLRERAHNDPSLNREVAKKETQINAIVEKLPPELKQQVQTAIMLLSASNSLEYKLQEEESKTRSMQFAQFKKIVDMMGDYKNTIEYMVVGAAKGRISAQSNLVSANLDVNGVSALASQARDANVAQYELDLKGIEEERAKAQEKLDKDEAAARASGDTKALQSINLQRNIVDNNAAQRTAEAILNFQKAQVEAAKQEYGVKMKVVDLANRQIDIQLDLAQTIGAPMETILALERQRVQQAREAAAIAEEQYNNLIKSGATQEEIEEAKLKMQEAQSKVIKDSLGAQRSAMEKLFGNMIGSFGEVAGIAGPNNIAGKYGLGYIQGPDGSVRKSDGKPSGGYRDHVFGNFAAGGVALRDGSIPGGSSTTINAQGSSPVTTPNVEVAKATSGATAKSKSMDGFSTLGEKFKDTKEGIEIAVFWEKKIYNLLEESFRTMIIGKSMSGWVQNPGIPGRPGVTAPFIDATALPAKGKKDPRSTVWIDPNAPKRNGAGGIPVIGEEKPKTETQTPPVKTTGEKPQASAQLPKEAQALIDAVSPMAMFGKNPLQDLVAQATSPKNVFTMTPEERAAWQKQQTAAEAASNPAKPAPVTTAPLPVKSPIQAGASASTQPSGGSFWSGMWNGTKNIAGDLWSGAKAVHATAVNGLANMLQPAIDEQEGVTPEMRAAVNAASNPAKPGTLPSSGSQNINVEVQVKFNNQMFENQVTKVVTSPSVAKNVVSTGMGKA